MVTEYDLIILDKISCQCYVNWAYTDNSETKGRKELLALHLKSALNTANEKPQILAMTSVTKKEFEDTYVGNESGTYHATFLTEASKELKIPFCFSEEDSILKVASWLKWKGINACILTGNSLLFEIAKKSGLNVYMTEDIGQIKIKSLE